MPDDLPNLNIGSASPDIVPTDIPLAEIPADVKVESSNPMPPTDENPNAQNVGELFEDRPSFLGDQAIFGGQNTEPKNHKTANFNKTYEANVQTNKKSHIKEIIIIGLGIFMLLISGGTYLFLNKDRYFGPKTVPSDQQVVPSTDNNEPSGKIDFGDAQLPEDINSDTFIRSLDQVSQENNVSQKIILLQQLDIPSVNVELMKITLQ